MHIEIKRWDNGVIIIAGEYRSLKDCLQKNKGKSFYRANLSDSDLSGSDLSGSNLSGSDLRGSDLRDSDLSGSDLSGSNLRGSNLSGSNLSGSNLSGSIIDPTNKPNAIVEGFQQIPGEEGWVYGYRTRATSAAGRVLQDDRIYGTEVFSTADTECHPGWYLWPSLSESKNYTQSYGPYVQVKARVIDIHKAGSKWRSRAIWIIGEVK
jgi:hypothetical protein